MLGVVAIRQSYSEKEVAGGLGLDSGRVDAHRSTHCGNQCEPSDCLPGSEGVGEAQSLQVSISENLGGFGPTITLPRSMTAREAYGLSKAKARSFTLSAIPEITWSARESSASRPFAPRIGW